MSNRYTYQQIEWLKDNVVNQTYGSLAELTNAYNNYFDDCRSESAISTKIGKDMGLRLNTGNPFTCEEKKWLEDNCRKFSSMKELLEDYNKLFSKRTIGSLTQQISRQGLSIKSWTVKEEKWILENYYLYESLNDLLNDFNKIFVRKRTLQGFSMHCQNRLKLKRYIPFTEEENQWIKDNIDNYKYEDLSIEFNKIFWRNTTKSSMQTYCSRKLGVNKEIPERFCTVPIGATKTKAGYTYIKTKEIDYNDENITRRAELTYEPLSRVIWRQYYGEIPDDCQIIFLDNNKTNYDIENLYCIKRKYLPYMKCNHWFSKNPDVTLTALKWCELMYATQE